MRRPWVAVLLLTALVVFALPAPARAHILRGPASAPIAQGSKVDARNSAPVLPAPAYSPAPVDPVIDADPAAWPTMPSVLLLALVLAASLVDVFRSRRTVAGLLIALLAVLAFEAGVHSVHHLGDADAAAQCVVASASSDLSGAGAGPVVVIVPAETGDVAPPPQSGTLLPRFAHPDRGRAPPFLA